MKILSGGQTGVDRAALDTAREAGIPSGGWCPLGRLAEDGVVPDHYGLQETPAPAYVQRTEWNVRDAEATLILIHGTPTGGTAYTIAVAGQLHKPLLVIDVHGKKTENAIHRWLTTGHYGVLNIAGPRESTSPGIYKKAAEILKGVFSMLNQTSCP